MGAFFGCIFVAAMILLAVGYGIQPHLIKMCEELKRIADALEGKDKK